MQQKQQQFDDRRLSTVTVASNWHSNPLANNNSSMNLRRVSTAAGAMQNSSQFFDDFDGTEGAPTLLKEVEKHSSLAATLFPDQTFFMAGRTVSGHMDLRCTSSKVKINSIKVELGGYEQVRDAGADRGGLSRHCLFRRTVILQGPGTPPTDAVQAENGCDAHHYWSARKGTARFRFVFDLDDGLPSTVNTRVGNVFYQLIGLVGMRGGGEPFTLRTSRDVVVYENRDVLTAWDDPLFSTEKQTWGMLSGKGSVELQCMLDKPQYWAGSQAYVTVKVVNDSNKKVSALKLTLIERVKSFRKLDSGRFEALKFKRTELSCRVFHGHDWALDCDRLREVIFDYPLPEIRSVRAGAQLLEVSFVLRVTVSALWSKDIVVELPFDVYHSCNANPPPKLSIARQVSSPTRTLESTSMAQQQFPHILPAVELPRKPSKVLAKAAINDSAFQSKASLYTSAADEPSEPLPELPPRTQSLDIGYPPEDVIIPLSSDNGVDDHIKPTAPQAPESHEAVQSDNDTRVSEFDDNISEELSFMDAVEVPMPPPRPPPAAPSVSARARSHFLAGSGDKFSMPAFVPEKRGDASPPADVSNSNGDNSQTTGDNDAGAEQHGANFSVAKSIDSMFEQSMHSYGD